MSHITRQTDFRKSPVLSPLAVAVRLSLVGLTLVHGTSQAATVTVTSSSDIAASGCTLREAMAALNDQSTQIGCNIAGNFGVDDTITFSSVLNSNNSITLLEGRLDLGPDSREVLIDASNVTGGITIDGNSESRVFFTNNVELELNNLTITGGSTSSMGGGIFATSSTIKLTESTVSGNTAATQGGGIYGYSSNIELTKSTVSDNQAVDGGGIYVRNSSNVLVNNNSFILENRAGDGGGVYARYSSSIILSQSEVSNNYGNSLRVGNLSYLSVSASTVTNNSEGPNGGGGGLSIRAGSSANVTNSTISSNTAGLGGAAFLNNSSTISLSNSTLSGNSATTTFTGNGGGALMLRNSNVILVNSTLSENSSNVEGDGVFLDDSSNMRLSNSIIASSVNGDDVYLRNASTVDSDTASIIEEASYGGSRTGDPGLLPLADNGGPTQTHALIPLSRARETGILTGAGFGFENCTTSDQRGQLRDNGDGACDIGAFEYSAIDVPVDEEIFYVIPLRNGKTVVIPL